MKNISRNIQKSQQLYYKLNIERLLGGDKSVGLGRCKIRLKEETLCWNSQCISSDKAFQSFKDEPEEWGALLEMLREESSE